MTLGAQACGVRETRQVTLVIVSEFGDDRPARADGAPGRSRRTSRRALAISLGALASVLVVVVVAVVAFVGRLNSNIERFDDPFAALPSTRPTEPAPAASQAAAPEPVDILLLGSDSRISAGDPDAWVEGAQRTDSIMLLHIPASRDAAYIMSIPRDSWVAVPGHGEAKINAAFAYGGAPLLIQTVESLTGVRVEHFAVTDFESFKTITDALGGVSITVPEDTYDGSTLVMAAGTHRLDGEQALAYVRQRHGLLRGDLDRVQRQQNWMRALMTEALNQGTLANAPRLVSLLDTVTRSLAVNDGFTLDEMRDLALSMRGIGGGDIQYLTVPVTGTGRSADGQSIVELDPTGLDALMAAVREDRVGAFLQENPAVADRLESTVR